MKSASFESYALRQIAIYTAMLDFLPVIKEVAKKFDGKVINARFTTALEAASPKTYVGPSRREQGMFFCSFDDNFGKKHLWIRLAYLDGEQVSYNESSAQFYCLEGIDTPIYGKEFDFSSFADRCDKTAETIRENIEQLRDEMAHFDEALEKYRAIYAMLKEVAPYRAAMKHTQEREFEFARRLADVYVGQ